MNYGKLVFAKTWLHMIVSPESSSVTCPYMNIHWKNEQINIVEILELLKMMMHTYICWTGKLSSVAKRKSIFWYCMNRINSLLYKNECECIKMCVWIHRKNCRRIHTKIKVWFFLHGEIMSGFRGLFVCFLHSYLYL